MIMKGFRKGVIDFIYGVATGTKRQRGLLTFLFGSAFFCTVLLLIILSFYLDKFLGLPEFGANPLRAVLSMPFLLGGAFLWLWCAGKFLKTKGTPVPVNPPPTLVIDGPYAYSRNPMMAGLFMVVAGIGIFSGSITLTFIMTPLFILISILEFRYIEEPELTKRFGKAYVEYKAKTPILFRINNHSGENP